ncbi:Putative short chain dehydrogenase/reductase family 42E member 2 [Heterocephalus glaber]|uniref:Putative short chain dehydrogenase/reductase family 42E member 2 n=1 Tax=Heterocephalus glaber TaxID=10181 RepID=G5BV85_HETGA|nr:Putative short chain dehydrogenase/reductase family 42E member 2 [Heterocephalus glaber]
MLLLARRQQQLELGNMNPPVLLVAEGKAGLCEWSDGPETRACEVVKQSSNPSLLYNDHCCHWLSTTGQAPYPAFGRWTVCGLHGSVEDEAQPHRLLPRDLQSCRPGREELPCLPGLGRAPAAGQKTQAKPGQAPRRKVLVTGGGGYLGFSLGSSLAERGTSVVLLDLRRPQWELPPRTEFTQADVRDEEALYRALEGVDCVFHAASCGMSGAEKLQKEQIESINVGGTKLVIDVCVRRRVPRLVYTSTVNVAFGGKPIEQGDEDSAPYFPLDKHMDHYSRTKAIADQLTLMANGTPLPGGGTLRTCVLRPPGIYGPEEQKHLPRVASYVKKRLFVFRFGDRRARMNWVHVRNLVQAHVLAAEALTAAKGYVAKLAGLIPQGPGSGQAYYINDGDSVNLFEWMAPLFEKLGYSQPWVQVPTSWVYLTAATLEYLHLALRPFGSLPLLLTRSEVQSVAVTHTFQINKARAQLGYAPDKFNFADSVERYLHPRSAAARSEASRGCCSSPAPATCAPARARVPATRSPLLGTRGPPRSAPWSAAPRASARPSASSRPGEVGGDSLRSAALGSPGCAEGERDVGRSAPAAVKRKRRVRGKRPRQALAARASGEAQRCPPVSR